MSRANPSDAEIKRTILFVDDVPMFRELGEVFLSRTGTVLTAASGEEALRLTREHAPDAVLLDIMMPSLDGFEATRAIREWEATGPDRTRAHIIALTANAMAGDRERCLKAGMDDYLAKPVAPSELLERLRRLEPPQLRRAG